MNAMHRKLAGKFFRIEITTRMTEFRCWIYTAHKDSPKDEAGLFFMGPEIFQLTEEIQLRSNTW